MPATQIKNRELFYIRGDIREIDLSAQGSNRGSQRQTCWHIGRDGAAWRFARATVLNLSNSSLVSPRLKILAKKQGLKQPKWLNSISILAARRVIFFHSPPGVIEGQVAEPRKEPVQE